MKSYQRTLFKQASLDLKIADTIALQVERLGTLHYLVLETDK